MCPCLTGERLDKAVKKLLAKLGYIFKDFGTPSGKKFFLDSFEQFLTENDLPDSSFATFRVAFNIRVSCPIRTDCSTLGIHRQVHLLAKCFFFVGRVFFKKWGHFNNWKIGRQEEGNKYRDVGEDDTWTPGTVNGWAKSYT